MFSGSVVRKLTASEQTFADSHMFFGGKAELRGEVDIDALSYAFDALCQHYPVFAAHLEPDSEGTYYFVADDLPHPGMWLFDSDSAGLDQFANAGASLDQSVSLMNLGLKVTDGGAELTLFVHHSLADGSMLMGLVEELFARYLAVISTGDPGPINPQPAPQPLEAMLVKRGIKKLARSGFERLIPLAFAYDYPERPKPIACGTPSGLPQKIPATHCLLTEQETSDLEEFGRANGLSFNAMIAATILMAEWQIRETPRIPVPYTYPVNLRLLVNPPLTATEATNPCGFACYLAEIGPDTDIIDLTEDIVETLRADLAAGLVQQSAMHFNPQFNESALYHGPSPVACTSVGSLPDMRTPDGRLEVAGFQAEVYFATDLPIDYYSYGICAGRLFIDHHSNVPGGESAVDAAHSLLRSIPSEYGMFME